MGHAFFMLDCLFNNCNQFFKSLINQTRGDIRSLGIIYIRNNKPILTGLLIFYLDTQIMKPTKIKSSASIPQGQIHKSHSLVFNAPFNASLSAARLPRAYGLISKNICETQTLKN